MIQRAYNCVVVRDALIGFWLDVPPNRREWFTRSTKMGVRYSSEIVLALEWKGKTVREICSYGDWGGFLTSALPENWIEESERSKVGPGDGLALVATCSIYTENVEVVNREDLPKSDRDFYGETATLYQAWPSRLYAGTAEELARVPGFDWDNVPEGDWTPSRLRCDVRSKVAEMVVYRSDVATPIEFASWAIGWREHVAKLIAGVSE